MGTASWAVAVVTYVLIAPHLLAAPGDGAGAAVSGDLPVIIKTRPVFLAEVLASSSHPTAGDIDEADIVRVEVVARGAARGFAYYDSTQLWRDELRLRRPEDFDNDGETYRWKIVGGMSFEDKRTEFEPEGEGGAPLGRAGTGIIDVKVWHRAGGDVTCTSVPVRVGMKKLYVEVDWFEGSMRKRVRRGGQTLTIPYKPLVDERFVDAFGQCGLEVVVCDTPEMGNTKNVITSSIRFSTGQEVNCENLSSLVDRRLRDETNAKTLNEGTSVIARWLVDNGYVNLDISRPDTVYMIGVQRWSRRRPAMGRTMGVVCLLEYQGRRMPMAFIFTRSIAESTAAVNRDQRTQVPFEVAARHTAIHEIAAHCFPCEWNNSRATEMSDPYWNEWRYVYAGHPKRPEGQDDYYRIYETCVTCAETGLDGAYYTFMNAPRLNDFRWRMANDAREKTRDIIRDHAIDGRVHVYGHGGTDAAAHAVAHTRGENR
jgi:hypothetical protein